MSEKTARLTGLSACGLLVCLLLFTQQLRLAVTDGLRLCAAVLIPALFPFCVGSNLFVLLGLPGRLRRRLAPVTERLFALPGEAAAPLLLGLIGGFPLGIQTLALACESGALSRRDAVRLSAFCNNAGPAFVLGAVGGTVFGSLRIGIALYVLQALAALLTGLTLRRKGPLRRSAPLPAARGLSPAAALPEAVSKASLQMLQVCGMVVFFSVLIALLRLLLPLYRLPGAVAAALEGALELTNGTRALAGLSRGTAFGLAALELGWSGLCVHLQAAGILSRAGLPLRPYLRGKLLQALWSAVLAVPVLLLDKSLHFL